MIAAPYQDYCDERPVYVSCRFGQPSEFLWLFSQPFFILIIFHKKIFVTVNTVSMKQIRNVLLGTNNMAADINTDFFLVILATNVDF